MKKIFILIAFSIFLITCIKTNKNETESALYIQEEKNINENIIDDNIMLEYTKIEYIEEKAIIITDNLSIFDSPSFFGKKINQLAFGSIITIYAIGNNYNLANEQFNYWYKISNTEDLWINALFVKKFPFYVNSEEKGRWNEFHEVNILINDINNGEYLINIPLRKEEEINIEVNKNIVIELFSFGKLVEYNFIIFNSKYDNLCKLLMEYIYDTKRRIQSVIIQNEYLIEGNFMETDSIYYMPGYKAYYTIHNTGFIKGLEITNKDEEFLFGLRAGESSTYLEILFGPPMDLEYSNSKNLIWVYYILNGIKVYFEIENDRVLSINYQAML